MSKDFGEMPLSASSERIRQAFRHLEQMSQEDQIDLMVKAKLFTPEQAERAKQKWAEIQAAQARLADPAMLVPETPSAS